MRHLSLLVIAALFMNVTVAHSQTPPKLKLGDPLPANLFVELSKALNPTVVNISTTSIPKQRQQLRGRPPGDPFQGFFEQFMNPNAPITPQQSLGTGFIIRKDGLIITNNHVIDGADIVKVQLEERTKTLYEAEVIGRDKRTDIALIKINAGRDLPVAVLGSSTTLQVGEWVLAIGNPYGHGHSVTKGIVSAMGREIDQINKFPFIQTDASINPGNSGGPLVNSKGEVIGVNTAIDARAQGIGFAIPIDDVKSILKTLEKDGLIRRAFIGVNMYPYPIDPRNAAELGLNTTEGALIIGLVENAPAAKAGLKEYDLVVSFDGRAVETSSDFSRIVQDAKVGSTYEVEYIREGKKRKTKVTLGEHPEDSQARPKKRTYQGQRAPFDLGFSVTNYSLELANELGLPRLRDQVPVVINVDADSPAARAGLGIGDIILDVNRSKVTRDVDVLKGLKQGEINSLRVIRGNMPILIYLNAKNPK